MKELYSLTNKIWRTSRSVAANIREGFAKRKYEQVFIRHLVDALGSSEETRTWLDFSKDCGYITSDDSKSLNSKYDEVSAMLSALINKWKTYK